MSIEEFRAHLSRIDATVPVDEHSIAGQDSPLAQPLEAGPLRGGNRWVIHPMEGWDGTLDGRPSDLTRLRWRHFGESGAKWVWGGEAVAVRHDGRANPNQLVLSEKTEADIAALRQELLRAHRERFDTDDDFIDGLQLTHSGRFSRPNEGAAPAPRVAYRHPILDQRVGVTSDDAVLTDGEVGDLIGDFVAAARRARDMGFRFVDIKHCHGYLLHEFLGAHTRPGPYGGSFENRTRLLRELVAGVRRDAPGLEIGVRLSVFDSVPFRPDPAETEGSRLGRGIPEAYSECLPYAYGFGVCADDPLAGDLSEAHAVLRWLSSEGVRLINVSAGSPYYNPHMQRPALYPPSDGYQPPEDPLLGVVRQLRAVRDLKQKFPELVLMGSAFSYLQDFLPHVAQALVRDGWMDAVGLGRVVLSYWDLPADVLAGKPLARKRICRTFSDCTTGPRKGLVSGCYPLDPYYRGLPEAATLRRLKRGEAENESEGKK